MVARLTYHIIYSKCAQQERYKYKTRTYAVLYKCYNGSAGIEVGGKYVLYINSAITTTLLSL